MQNSLSLSQYFTELVQNLSLLGLCALLQKIELFASPPSEENSMVVVLFASLLPKSGILFLSLSITILPSLPSKLALKLTSSNSILTSNSFSGTNLELALSLALYYSSFSPCIQTSL